MNPLPPFDMSAPQPTQTWNQPVQTPIDPPCLASTISLVKMLLSTPLHLITLTHDLHLFPTTHGACLPSQPLVSSIHYMLWHLRVTVRHWTARFCWCCRARVVPDILIVFSQNTPQWCSDFPDIFCEALDPTEWIAIWPGLPSRWLTRLPAREIRVGKELRRAIEIWRGGDPGYIT